MSFTQRIFDFFSRKSTKSKGGGDKAIRKQKAGGKPVLGLAAAQKCAI